MQFLNFVTFWVGMVGAVAPGLPTHTDSTMHTVYQFFGGEPRTVRGTAVPGAYQRHRVLPTMPHRRRSYLPHTTCATFPTPRCTGPSPPTTTAAGVPLQHVSRFTTPPTHLRSHRFWTVVVLPFPCRYWRLDSNGTTQDYKRALPIPNAALEEHTVDVIPHATHGVRDLPPTPTYLFTCPWMAYLHI